jgi:hypothetical protein
MTEGTAVNTRGIPSRVCLCGNDVFKILVKLDEENEIAWYTLNGYCVECRSPVTLPLPEYANGSERAFDDE